MASATSPTVAAPAAAQAAAWMLEAGCFQLRAPGQGPFILPSGWASPAYMDGSRLISLPALRRALMKQGLQRLLQAGVLQAVDAIAGGESSGIAFAAWLAEKLDLPLHYVRKRAVGQRQVEGMVEPGSRVLLVDDMVSAGEYKLSFVDALRAQGAQVHDLFVLFDYGTWGAQQELAAHGVQVHALACWRDVLEQAQAGQCWSEEAVQEMAEFLAHPAQWSLRQGGRGH